MSIIVSLPQRVLRLQATQMQALSAAEKQAAKADYIAMMADIDMDDLLAVDDAGTDTGMDMDMPTDIEGSETDGEQEV